MAYFSFTRELQAFDGVDLLVDYQFTGTYQDVENYTFDHVEVQGRGFGLSWDGWRRIDRLHPLHHAADAFLNTPDAADEAERLIRAEMAEMRPRRATSVLLDLVSA